MKVDFKFLMLFLFLSLTSCDKTELTIGQTPTIASRIPGNSGGALVGYTDITSMHINNGLANQCFKNILVFPSWERYSQVIDNLDAETEAYCDAFDAQQPANQTDLEYDNTCLLANFDEDKKIVQFENYLSFCSLRKKILTQEEAWLAVQGDGAWNINEDPDEHFIDDETERAVLNEGVEVIIKDYKGDMIIYKFTDDYGGYISISNMDITALQQINAGGSVDNNPNVVVVPPKPVPATPNCKEKVKEVDYHYGPNNTRIKQISKIRREWGENLDSQTAVLKGKIKVKTKGYVKRSGSGWKGKRTWITAGINGITIGSTGSAFDNCSEPIFIQKIKEKRRRKVKVKTIIDPFVGVLPQLHRFSVKDNKLYSLHKQGQTLIINRDFYDMPEN